MATITRRGLPVTTIGELLVIGSTAPAFELVGPDLATISSDDLAGRRLVLNIFPSIDTGVCAASVRRFNAIAAGLENTAVVCVSQDLPFAHDRFCAAEDIENVITGSAFRSSFGTDYGVTMVDSPMRGLFARAVVVAGADGTVLHTELVSETGHEPDYDAAIAALG